MDRRLLNFFVASTLFLLIYLGLSSLFPPPPRQNAGPNGAPEAAANLENPATPDEPASPANAEAAKQQSDLVLNRPEKWLTLGSMDPADGYNMLVTFSTRGGAIERVELTERKPNGRLKYRRVDVRSGYLGYLAPQMAPGGSGAIVNVVGPGTPAALAKDLQGAPGGLLPGDIIVAAANQAISSPSDLELALLKTEPGSVIQLEVLRTTPPAPPTSDADSEATGSAAATKLVFEVTLSEHPLDLVRLASTAGEDQIQGNLNRASCLMTLAKVGNSSILAGQREMTSLVSQHKASWEVSSNVALSQVGFDLALPAELVADAGGAGPVTLQREYVLEKGKYTLGMKMRVVNQATVPQDLQYRLEGPNGITLEGWWYSTKISPNFSSAAARDFVYSTAAEGRELISAYNLLKQTRNYPQDPDDIIFTLTQTEEQRALNYIGIDAQYFLAAYVPAGDNATINDYASAAGMIVADPAVVPRDQERAANISFYLDSLSQTVPPQGAIEDSLVLFLGPKDPELLETYGVAPVLEYGWFSWVAKPLSWLLHGFHMIVGNYALAIIMLTLLVRGCMFPLSRKAAVHAQKMQELAPELKKIAEKYKDDFEKRLKAQRELQQRVGFNPLSGCLPMFIQLPIFIGLYRALSVDIELRQAALSSHLQWASNLAGPDMLFYWGDWLWEYLSGRGTGWLGPYFNILPIVVVALFLVQQKMFMPPATDEQTAITQKVMTVMTLVMGLFFFRVPSGLCVYFITSSIWGIAERKLVKKMVPATPQLALGGTVDGTVVSSKTVDSGKQTIADRLRSAAGMQTPETGPVVPPHKRKRPPGSKK